MSAGDREAEAQAKKSDDGSSSDRASRIASALKQYWCVGLRAVELVLAVVAIGLMTGAVTTPQVLENNHRHIALFFSAFSSFIIITGVLVIARLFGETVGWRTSLGFSLLGGIMFTIAAAFIFYDWHNSYFGNLVRNRHPYNLLISSGVFAIVNAAVFIFHAFTTFRQRADY